MMKCLTLCLVLSCAFNVLNCYPQRVTLVGLPRSDFFGNFDPQLGRDSEYSTDVSDDTSPLFPGADFPTDFDSSSQDYPSFSEVMRRMQETMFRLRQEMNKVLTRLPESPDEKGIIPSGDDVFGFGDLDLNNVQNKSTSEVKIIDGHKVIVNETVIKSGNDDSGSIFRIKTIQLKPDEPTGVTTSDVDSTTHSEELPQGTVNPPIENISNVNKNEDSNDIPNEGKVGSEVEDLNKEYVK